MARYTFVNESPLANVQTTPPESALDRFVEIDPHTGRQVPVFTQGEAPGLLQTIRDYLGIHEPKTTPLEIEAAQRGVRPYDIRQEVFGTGKVEEFQRVIGRGMSGLTGGLTDIVRGYEEHPETWPGAMAGAAADLAGFAAGPLKLSSTLTGTRLMPTAGGLRGVAQIMAAGGANLALASSLSSLMPSLIKDDRLTQLAYDAVESAAIGGLVGALYPVTGFIENKPLRLAVSLAVMDKIRSGPGQWFTIDDVAKGVANGTIDANDLARASFNYLMDIYFTLRVPSMRKQLAELDNLMARQIDRQNAEEVEQTIVNLGKKGDVGPEPTEGITAQDVARSFGSEKNLNEAVNQTREAESAARKVEAMYNQADSELKSLRSVDLKRIRKQVASAIVDVSGEVKKQLLKQSSDLGKEAMIRHDLIRGMGAKSDAIFAEAEGKIYTDLSKSEQKLLDRIIQSRRTVTIDERRAEISIQAQAEGKEPLADLKHPGGLGGEVHKNYLETLRQNQPEVFAKLNQRADAYFSAMQEQLMALKDHGLIDRPLYDRLTAIGDYSPRRFIQYLDPDRTYTFSGGPISVPDSGIKRLDAGSTRMLENNSRLLLYQVIVRTHRRIARNEANRALYELAKQMPDNPIVHILKPKESDRPESETLSVVINGKQQRMAMPRELARQWVESDPAIDSSLANMIGWLSGTKILRPMATGLNPEFALTNMPRDMIHIWLTTHEYSPILPKFVAQLGKDYVETAKDAVFRRGAYTDFINEGGGMSFLVHQGRLTSERSGAWKQMQDVLGYLGETSEIWTRLALRNRALKNNKAPHEATWVARNYLDFSQGGWAIKGVDTAVPYLNASVQATRGLFRAAKENPQELTWKFAQLATVSMGLYLANRLINEDAWKSIPARDKVNNFIITTPLSYIDESGNTRWLYFKMAKDQSQRVVSTAFEAMMAKTLGDPIDGDQVAQAVQDALPLMPTQTVPPTISAMLGYFANKDFWRNEDIWKGPVTAAREEYTPYTHPALREAGQLTGLSPERMGYVLSEFFTYGNIYTSLVGAGTEQIMKTLGAETREEVTGQILRQIPFARRFMAVTDPYEPFRKEIEQARLEAQTKAFVIQRELDQMSEKFYRTQAAGEDAKALENQIREYIRTQPPEMQEGLVTRHLFYGSVYNIPDRRFWLNLKSLPAEARAVVFWTRWNQAQEAEKERLMKQAAGLPGIVSENFLAYFDKLRGGSK